MLSAVAVDVCIDSGYQSCPPASSYPVVPFTCPAKNKFLIIFDSNVCFNWVGSK